MWIAERVLEQAEREANDPAVIEQTLLEADAKHERGELSDEELAELEEQLVGRLAGQRGWYG
jgi:hypothetical protein